MNRLVRFLYFKKERNWAEKAARLLLQWYGAFLSPLIHQSLIIPGGCRFQPTCSAYGVAVFRQYGLLSGFVLLVKRLARCHPWSIGGYDPPPDGKEIFGPNRASINRLP